MNLHELTPEAIDRLEASDELDTLIAESLGWIKRSIGGPGDSSGLAGFINTARGEPYYLQPCKRGRFARRFYPSSSADDAFTASDKFGLFGSSGWVMGKTIEAEWCVGPMGCECDFDRFDGLYTVAPTPALAICRAILKIELERRRT